MELARLAPPHVINVLPPPSATMRSIWARAPANDSWRMALHGLLHQDPIVGSNVLVVPPPRDELLAEWSNTRALEVTRPPRRTACIWAPQPRASEDCWRGALDRLSRFTEERSREVLPEHDVSPVESHPNWTLSLPQCTTGSAGFRTASIWAPQPEASQESWRRGLEGLRAEALQRDSSEILLAFDPSLPPFSPRNISLGNVSTSAHHQPPDFHPSSEPLSSAPSRLWRESSPPFYSDLASDPPPPYHRNDEAIFSSSKHGGRVASKRYPPANSKVCGWRQGAFIINFIMSRTDARLKARPSAPLTALRQCYTSPYIPSCSSSFLPPFV
ncbi:hypothetical protein B0H13DRAFT_1972434 [Mycena leptocephala]|nr:hypothetical protein B0H13DRAFT_1972434 [Mycena leptocephala]